MNKSDSAECTKMLELLDIYNLQQHVTKPTHISANILDLIITNQSSKFILTELDDDYYISDHRFVSCRVNLVKPKLVRQKICVRKLREINLELFQLDLASKLENAEAVSDVDELVNVLNGALKSTLDDHAPVTEKVVSNRKRVPWFDDNASCLKRKLRTREKFWLRTRSSEAKSQFKIARRTYHHYLYKAKALYMNNIVTENQNDSRKLFSSIATVSGSLKSNPLPDSDSDSALADDFAEYFWSKIETIRSTFSLGDVYEPRNVSCTGLTCFKAVTPESVAKVIRDSKTTTCSQDPIPTTLLKNSLTTLLPIITRLINLSLTQGTFPSCWKEAVILPLLKKPGLEPALSNYRPVSNLTFLSKVLEKIVLQQVVAHVDAHSLLPDYQSAYRANYSTEMVLLRLCDTVLNNMEQQRVTIMAALDLSAAFDTVDHSILQSVLLRRFAISDTVLQWFTSYLEDRVFKVQIGVETSTRHTINYSVPQGSCGGPVLFTMYAATLDDHLASRSQELLGYADDHSLLDSFKAGDLTDELATVHRLEQSLAQTKEWMFLNKLKMNESKSEIILFGNKRQVIKAQTTGVHVGDCVVEKSESVNYLGVTLDSDFTFQAQIAKKCSKASFGIHLLRGIVKYLSLKSAKIVASALVLSHLDFSNSLYSGLPAVRTQPLQRIQNYAAKVVLNRRKFDSSYQSLKDLHWLPISYRADFKLVTIVHKAIYGSAPNYITDLLQYRVQTRNTRSSMDTAPKLHPPFTRLKTFADRSFSKRGPDLWNKLSENLRNTEDLEMFKKHLKTHYFNLYFNR